MIFGMLNQVKYDVNIPSVLWHCWLGGRKGIRPVKNLSGEVLVWLSVWSEVQTCIWPSWCHCHSLSLAPVKSRLVLPFWYRLARVDPDKGPLNGCIWREHFTDVCTSPVKCRRFWNTVNVLKFLVHSRTGQAVNKMSQRKFKQKEINWNRSRTLKSTTYCEICWVCTHWLR